jgi:hypothetical protein
MGIRTYQPALIALVLVLLFIGCSQSKSGAPSSEPADTAVDDSKIDAVDTSIDSSGETIEPDTVGPPPLPDRGPQPTADGRWQWLSHHDGTVSGSHKYTGGPDAFYEYTRFEIFQPFRLRAVKVQVDVFEPTELKVYVWDDWGGDFLALNASKFLATLSIAVTPEDSRKWLELKLDTPLTVDPGRMFYVGVIVSTVNSPRMVVDANPSWGDAGVAPSLVWMSNEIHQETGTKSVFSTAAADYLVSLEVQHINVIQDDAFLFEPIGVDALGFPGIGRGGFADYDNDGDIDIMTSGPKLYRNNGDGTFADVSGDAIPAGVASGGGVWGDYDNDGDPDYFGVGLADVLLRNDGGVFVDVTETSGIDDSQNHTCDGQPGVKHVPTETAAWVDFDGDGRLDLYQGNFICWSDGYPSRDRLYRNNGDGTFTNWTVESGIETAQGNSWAARGIAPADYDNDGDMDILVTNYRLHRNFFWRNNGDGTFVDVGKQTKLEGTPQMAGSSWAYGHSIGAAWGDFYLTGNLDVFVANLAHPRFFHFSDKQTLYASSGGPDPVFLDITNDVGIRYQETASNPTAWDFDNDGDLDLTWTCVYDGRPTQFYRNDWPTGKWTEVSYPSGLVTHNGWGSMVGDFDNDGDLDYFANQAFLNRNRFGNYAIQIRPRGMGDGATNRSGYGARVLVTFNGVTRMQELSGAHGTTCQDSPWLHFGLRKNTSADVKVVFPNTQTTLDFTGLSAGRYTVYEDGTLEKD